MRPLARVAFTLSALAALAVGVWAGTKVAEAGLGWQAAGVVFVLLVVLVAYFWDELE